MVHWDDAFEAVCSTPERAAYLWGLASEAEGAGLGPGFVHVQTKASPCPDLAVQERLICQSAHAVLCLLPCSWPAPPRVQARAALP